MTLRDYLKSRYGREFGLSISKAQANYLRIPYPLIQGWLSRHGDEVLDAENIAYMDRIASKHVQTRLWSLIPEENKKQFSLI